VRPSRTLKLTKLLERGRLETGLRALAFRGPVAVLVPGLEAGRDSELEVPAEQLAWVDQEASSTSPAERQALQA
jgi:hypothetical protein